jgi:bacillopeptidase F
MLETRPALDALKGQGLIQRYEVLPYSNTLIIDVPEARANDAWRAINELPGVGQVVRNRLVQLDPIEMPKTRPGLRKGSGNAAEPRTEWNVTKVGAPTVWAQGVRGAGITVGIIDTGADVTHPGIGPKYRGMNADGTMTNSYNFFDAFGKKTVPYDDQGHGTHVTGTSVGGTADYAFGVAPDAKWIAAKILDGRGSGTLESVTKGLEWMLAPRDENGANPDPSKAPDVVNNSWGTNDGKLQAFRKIWQAYEAAGIGTVAAAGNSGPRPRTLGAPGSYPEGISVAATDKNDLIASFSSRGPSPIKNGAGSDFKPDVAAPGKDVTSSVPGGKYATYSGTSMATPATTGVVALLLSKHRDMSNAEIAQALIGSVKDLGKAGYDYDYGHGRIDAAGALAAADKIVAARKQPTEPARKAS